MGTGDDFKEKMEDYPYEVHVLEGEGTDPFAVWTGRIIQMAIAAVFIFMVVVGCIAFWRWVF